jgi:hypothetical protein
MGSFFYLSLFFCAGPILLLIVCVRMLWQCLVIPGTPREPVCGRCGYGVEGLSTLMCPECGADLLVAGISTRAILMRSRGSTLWAVIAWTLVWFTFAGGGFMTFGSMLITRRAMAQASTMTQTWTNTLTPKSGAAASVIVATEMRMATSNKAAAILVTLTLNDGSAWDMRIDPSAGEYSVIRPDKTEAIPSTSLGPGAAGAFFAAAGLDITSAAIKNEADDLDVVIKSIQMSPYTTADQLSLTAYTAAPVSYTSSGTPALGIGPDAMMFAIAGAVFLVFWIVGIALILVRRRAIERTLDLRPAPRTAADHSPGM